MYTSSLSGCLSKNSKFKLELKVHHTQQTDDRRLLREGEGGGDSDTVAHDH